MSKRRCFRAIAQPTSLAEFIAKLFIVRSAYTWNVPHFWSHCHREVWIVSAVIVTSLVGCTSNCTAVNKGLVNFTAPARDVLLHSTVEVGLHWPWQVRRAENTWMHCELIAALVLTPLWWDHHRHTGFFLKIVNYVVIFVGTRPNFFFCWTERVVVNTSFIKAMVFTETSFEWLWLRKVLKAIQRHPKIALDRVIGCRRSLLWTSKLEVGGSHLINKF